MQFKGPTEAVRHVAAIHPKRQIAVLISRGDKKIKPRTYSKQLIIARMYMTQKVSILIES
jgi:hypothetical protein